MTETERAGVLEAEARCREVWSHDPYGVGPELSSKRFRRGWDISARERMRDKYVPEQSEVAGLLLWEGGASGVEVYPGRLPWEPTR